MMSIAAFERTIERPGLIHGISCGSSAVDRTVEEEETSSSSSIGRNSDSGDGGGGDSGDGEVQSEFKGPLDCLDALEEVLPIKRGVSKFYNGKSKSFTSLADVVSCSSIKEIVKPENALTRKRKISFSRVIWEKNSNFPPINNGVGIPKKPTNSNRSTSTISNESRNGDICNSNASSPILSRPPLHPQNRKPLNDESSPSPPCRTCSPWRSFSLSDLQGAAAAATPTTALVINKGEGTH